MLPFVLKVSVKIARDQICRSLRSRQLVMVAKSSFCPACRSMSSLSIESLVYSEFGDPAKVVQKENLSLDVKDEQILVKMLAAPINPADINTIQGTYAIKPESFPALPGNEGVGIVKKLGVGPNPFNIKEDDWVIPCKNNMGSWRSHMIGWNQDFIPVPRMDLVSAATIGVNPPTAYRMLKDFEFLKLGDTVIQNGGNSAVGQMVIQLCKEFQLRSVSVVRSRDNFDQLKAYLKSLGNADTIIINEEELRKGKDIQARLALNCVGGKSATDLLRVLDNGGTMVTYGGMSRQPLTIPISALIFKDIKLVGFWISRWNKTHNAESRGDMIRFLAERFAKGTLKPPDAELIPIANYKEALENSMKGFVGKKFVLTFE